ncbi:MAG: hypothetical protein AAF970_06285 [Bacteroidota bacterium]
MPTINRRDFLTTVAACGTGLLLGACRQDAESSLQTPTQPFWSGDLTRLALIQDAVALMLALPTVPSGLERALGRTEGTPHMGLGLPPDLTAASLFAGTQKIGILGRLTDDPRDLYRIALATGHFMHHVAEAQIGPALEAKGLRADRAEIQRYQDAEVVRSLLPAPPATVAEAQALFEVLMLRLRLKAQAIVPDSLRPADWVLALLDWDAGQTTQVQALAAVVAAPDPVLQARYVRASAFFDANDPLVQRARRPGAGGRTVPLAGPSLYAQALDACVGVLTEVGRFVEGVQGANRLVQRLMERLGTSV